MFIGFFFVDGGNVNFYLFRDSTIMYGILIWFDFMIFFFFGCLMFIIRSFDF